MTFWQLIFITIFGVFNFIIFFKGLDETVKKRSAYKLTKYLFFIGAFVWGDVVVLAPFWVAASLLSVFTNNWFLFLLIISVFWSIRSIGETFYWFNQQFSMINRNPPEKLQGFHFFKNNSIWFVYQLTYQCIAVLSIIASIYLTNQWLTSLTK